MVIGALLILMALVLGYLGWVLPSAGGSLVVPTLIVIGIGCVLAVALTFFTRSLVLLLVAMVVVALASIWTFSFSIPASLTWDSAATSHAEAVLAQLGSSPKTIKGVSPPHPCSIVRSGTVGPIDAPYRMCSDFTPEGHFVTFTAVGHNDQGLGYTDVGASTFEDECSRHLVGKWWMFNGHTNGLGSCPIGYQFHGGA